MRLFLFFAFGISISDIRSTWECIGLRKKMKKLYHFCISAGDEVMFRSQEDFTRAFNCYAYAISQTESNALADSFMSNHFHACAESADIRDLIFHYRASYSRYFNRKYMRRGALGERMPYIIDVVGVYHRLAALSYTLRNAVHHGVSPTPFAYQHNSSNAIFRKELGKDNLIELLPRHKYHMFLPDKVSVPDHYVMSKSGLLLRETVIDVQQVEYIYGSPRNYIYYMNRITGEEWEREQLKDGGTILTLSDIETGVSMNELSAMLRNEHARENYGAISDMRLCEIIDNEILPQYGVLSVYHLSEKAKCKIANDLWSRFRVSKDMLKRCLVM